MVVNADGQVVGLLTLKMLLKRLLGKVPEDDFSDDDNVMAVAKR
jgi:CBS domain containing-hemolysin-like protein